ncbi:conserved hypothetical protein [Magnetococcus marinus MC-1]|uniref:Uncharacterized protein n=1 Tax=Magnetococcus marinus (strain ATCC BAA-1437 / JCM 17883 / MC-1) TaxID=156889 RepID=A0L520_MAGMM|nr:hypothetical protein [Magnetococcus marinus]ABK43063.1 conserved hypothetical protein [Magnetococcus marinus MC-1]
MKLFSSMIPQLTGMTAATVLGWVIGSPPAWADDAPRSEWSGYMAGELRLFPEAPLRGGQVVLYPALSAQGEYFRAWDQGHKQLRFTPFVRLDAQDHARSHVDLRELAVTHLDDANWEVSVGLRKLYWGVTESRHLVDILNQTDAVEGIDGEDKLGQPMLSAGFFQDWGTLNLYWMPYFRERTLPGWQGRPGYFYRVRQNEASYESPAQAWHQDFAVRYSHTVDMWDFSLSHFSGTAREPQLRSKTEASGALVLYPYYYQLEQTGLTVQATTDAWLWKFEGVTRHDLQGRSLAAVGGFEYTFVGILESDADLGLISEYMWEEQGNNSLSPFQNDLMVGGRVTLNDTQSTEFLAGAIADLESHALYLSVEASRRLGEQWKLSLDGWSNLNLKSSDPLYSRRRDSMLQLELARYF